MACDMEDEPQLPFEVATTLVTDITDTSAVCSGLVISKGGSALVSKGICWSLSPSPIISDKVMIDSTPSDSITGHLDGLMVYTTYYFRAFAITSVDTAYGEEVSFTTEGGIVTDIDGNVYHTVSIGSQVWLAENLRTTRFQNGDSIPYVDDMLTWRSAGQAYCFYDNDPGKYAMYGCLYNWYTVADTRQLSPAGWHVPTTNEWNVLAANVEGNGGHLKEKGTSHWASPNFGATNTTGFTALAGGYRDFLGTYDNARKIAAFWTATPYSDIWGNPGGWYRYLIHDGSAFSEYQLAAAYGCSVRCIRD